MSSSPGASSTIQVRPHPTKGRALHATKAFQPTQTILSFTPLLLLPTVSHLTSICSYCLKPGDPRACSRCHAAYYCNATCQAAAWKTVHSRECKPLRQGIKDEQRRRELPTPLKALMQALLCREIEEGLGDLEGHVLERRAEGDKWADLEMMAMGACAFSGKGTEEGTLKRAVELLCKIQNNSFQRFDPELGSIGLFLEPTLAMANHSCIPNAIVQFIGRKVFLMAETPIQAGDEIEIAYTFTNDPLSQRREALSHFKFICQCPRCKDNLNVYQACALAPNIRLNSQSVVTDLARLQHHPATTDPKKQHAAKVTGKPAYNMAKAVESTESPLERWKILNREFTACKSLVKEDLWAVTPLPEVLFYIALTYSKEGNFAFALAVVCFVATECDPFQYVSPFNPSRLTRLLAMAKLLTHTAHATASLTKSGVKPVSSSTAVSLEQKVQELLQEIDQVSLCQMLLLLIMRWVPAEYGPELSLIVQAKGFLDDIEKLAGREKEISLIDAWRRDPSNETSQAFFDFGVVQQVNSLANLGRAIVKRDFEDKLGFST